MPYLVNWSGEDLRVLRSEISAPYTAEDVLELMRQSNSMIDEVNHEVISVVDLSQSGEMPQGMLSHFTEISSMVNERVVLTIVILNSRLAEVIGGVVSRLVGRMSLVRTREQAEEVLSQFVAMQGQSA